jgi:hypothetical protein
VDAKRHHYHAMRGKAIVDKAVVSYCFAQGRTICSVGAVRSRAEYPWTGALALLEHHQQGSTLVAVMPYLLVNGELS